MHLFSARRWSLICVLLFTIILVNLLFEPAHVFAQSTPTPIPTGSIAPTPTGQVTGSTASWAFDTEVTEVGKNADRARQLLWWVFSHPGISTAPVILQIWSISRNIVYIFVIMVIVAFGFSFILLRKRASAVNIPPILLKIGLILIYVTFSYLLILALIQISEIIMRFFIENVGGKDLFNVIFAGSGNSESNYSTFLGFRDTNPANQEMVHTSLFLIRMTSFTYFIMSILILLRIIILWFLMVISPFLAILLPFIFIRNIGLIWIGVFLQWLFYGPLMALFLATVTKIWISGIPFSFDFTRTGQPSGQVYRTAVNILYGGPAQTLSAGNSANYVDTYAEYVITLVMLWVAIILPWLLLRIFRDYCCSAIAASNATLSGIFDRIRQYPPPAPSISPVAPTVSAGIAVALPFRQSVSEKISEIQRTSIMDIKEISRVNTTEIAKAMDLSVNSLTDISHLEMNQLKKSQLNQELSKISSPERITSVQEREQYAKVKSELQTRAAGGDRMAQALLTASSGNSQVIASQVSVMVGDRPAMAVSAKSHGIFAPSAPLPARKKPLAGVPTVPVSVGGKTVQAQVSVEDYEEVKKMWLTHYREAPIPETETIKNRQTWLEEEEKKLTNIFNLLASFDLKQKQKGLDQVAEILPFMLLGGFSEAEISAYIKAKLEATKQIQTELEMAEKIKAQTKAEVKEEEETLLEVGSQKKEEKKQAVITKEEKMDIPKETPKEGAA